MQNPRSFYQNRINTLSSELTKTRNKLRVFGTLRLGTFILTALLAYLLYVYTSFFVLTLLVGGGIFLALVSRYTDIRYQKNKLEALIRINKVELEVLDGSFHQLSEGIEFREIDHPYSHDIDLFGRGSFYQYCNRTALSQGSNRLAGLLKENDINKILDKQEAVRELGGIPKWRQGFAAEASLVRTETSVRVIKDWMQNYRPFVPSVFQWLPWVFGLVSVFLFVGFTQSLVPGWLALICLLLGLGISGRFFRRTNQLVSETSKIQDTLRQYQKLISLLEDQPMEASHLAKMREKVIRGNERTSKLLKRFSGLLNALEQRNNIIIGILTNAFLLRDLYLSYKIENWIRDYGAQVEGWFETIAFFDAYNSLGNFAFNHPDYNYPTISKGNTLIKGLKMGHPLLDAKRRVKNDFEIRQGEFLIVTGANMAGKSTFLRTVSLHIVMANMGLPVCAAQMIYKPVKLITSMRTSDSLADDESYFFSELKRLKSIVDKLQEAEYFVALDEILKGTNSTDKAKGSRQFLERLVASQSTGIIATHDLSLCEVAKEHEEVKNYYFDAEIIDDELHFDYKLKKGICKNMNASFLLKKMKIVE